MQPPRTLAEYVGELLTLDDDWRLRVVVHEFGMIWRNAAPSDRFALVADEPYRFDRRWDAFLAAYAEHLCWHERLDPPSWVLADDRYLDDAVWFVAGWSPTLRIEAIVHAPAAFEAHGVMLSDRELLVV